MMTKMLYKRKFSSLMYEDGKVYVQYVIKVIALFSYIVRIHQYLQQLKLYIDETFVRSFSKQLLGQLQITGTHCTIFLLTVTWGLLAPPSPSVFLQPNNN